MLIESNDLHERITQLASDAEDSELNYTCYKAVISCIKQLRAMVASLEAAQTAKNAQHKYSDAVEGLKDR